MMRVMLVMFVFVALVGCARAPEEKLLSQSIDGLPDTKPSETVAVPPDGVFDLEAQIVRKEINGKPVRMFGYNGQIPGPVLHVKQNSTITVNFKNSLDMPTTVHWHGLRLENQYDGVPNVTQAPVLPGETFVYELKFPDEGVYWYHPHVREDAQQELGLYGGIIVEPTRKDYYNSVDREEVIFLDDLRLMDGQPEPFFLDKTYYALMGRFGNQMLVNGKTDYSFNVNAGEVVRLYFIDTANTRMFNVSIPNASLKVVGGDSGLYEREFWADSVVLAPAERAIVEVLFDKPGMYTLVHSNPERTYELGRIQVDAAEQQRQSLNAVRENRFMQEDINRYRKYFDASPDFEIDLTIEMEQMSQMQDHGAMMMSGEKNGGIEWEDEMVVMNAMATSEDTKWIMRDKKTGKENMDVRYRVKVGDVKKLRIFNDPKSMHPMQHPIHLHGQRFLVLSENGKQNTNFVWKDVVTVPTGATVDLLVDFSNPGEWMIHCHIAEHLESGMMALFEVIA